MDKAGLFPGEGATFKLQITKLPHCCAHPTSAIEVGCFGKKKKLFFFSSISHHPAPCAVPVLVSLVWGGTAAGLEGRFPRALE